MVTVWFSPGAVWGRPRFDGPAHHVPGHRPGYRPRALAGPGRHRWADLTVALTRPQLVEVLAGTVVDGVETTGDATVLDRLYGLLDEPDPGVAIVIP